MSAFADSGSIRPQQIWEGLTSRAVHGKEVTLNLLKLEPNAVVPEHSHVNEQIGILVEGLATFRIGDETGEVRPGGTWCIPANVPHTVTIGPEGAVIVEVFSPPRHDWRDLPAGDSRPARWPR
jgi:quercetin dioxygenase-like cupin family protein